MIVKILVAVENSGGNTEEFIVLELYKPYWNEKSRMFLLQMIFNTRQSRKIEFKSVPRKKERQRGKLKSINKLILGQYNCLTSCSLHPKHTKSASQAPSQV